MRSFNLLKLFGLLLIVVTLASCKEEPDLIGLDLIPDSELLNHSLIDTLSIVAYTVREDTLRTDELATNLLGAVNDPVFGVTKASVYTEFRLSNLNVSFGTEPIADSLVLTVAVKGIYGDTLQPHQIEVYELAGNIDLESKYYANSTALVEPVPIGSLQFTPEILRDSLNKISYTPLKITLSQEYANRLINADTSTLANSDSLRRVFKGLYLKTTDVPSGDGGAMLYLDFLSTNTSFTMHYRNGSDTVKRKVEFRINEFAARFNSYEHNDYQGSDPLFLQQIMGDTSLGQQKLYLQSMGGTTIKLQFPYLNELSKQKILIHQAVLILQAENEDDKYPVPALIGIRKIKDKVKGGYLVLPDEAEGGGYVGGYADENEEYRIRITRYIQNRLLNPEEEDNGLVLIAAGSSLAANRAVFNGPDAENGMKLLIYYSPIQ